MWTFSKSAATHLELRNLFMVCIRTVSIFQTSNVQRQDNSLYKSESMRKEVVVVHFEILSRNFAGRSEQNR
jgi:hypothetical protein